MFSQKSTNIVQMYDEIFVLFPLIDAKTREECEEKITELIKTMKAEIAAEKKKAKMA